MLNSTIVTEKEILISSIKSNKWFCPFSQKVWKTYVSILNALLIVTFKMFIGNYDFCAFGNGIIPEYFSGDCNTDDLELYLKYIDINHFM